MIANNISTYLDDLLIDLRYGCWILKVVPKTQTELSLAVLEELVTWRHALEVLKAESQQVAVIFGSPLPAYLKHNVAAPIKGLEYMSVGGYEG